MEDVLPRSRWVQGRWFTPLLGAPHPTRIYPRIGGRKRGSEQNRRHDMSRAPGVAPQLCRILRWRMYYQGQDGYREGGSPHSSVPPTRYIPGLGVEKGGANRIADTICPVRLGSRPTCVGSCGGGCTTKFKMGTGKVVPPTQRCPPLDISQDWGRKRENEKDRRHDISRAPGVAPQLCRILRWRMFYQGQRGHVSAGTANVWRLRRARL